MFPVLQATLICTFVVWTVFVVSSNALLKQQKIHDPNIDLILAFDLSGTMESKKDYYNEMPARFREWLKWYYLGKEAKTGFAVIECIPELRHRDKTITMPFTEQPSEEKVLDKIEHAWRAIEEREWKTTWIFACAKDVLYVLDRKKNRPNVPNVAIMFSPCHFNRDVIDNPDLSNDFEDGVFFPLRQKINETGGWFAFVCFTVQKNGGWKLLNDFEYDITTLRWAGSNEDNVVILEGNDLKLLRRRMDKVLPKIDANYVEDCKFENEEKDCDYFGFKLVKCLTNPDLSVADPYDNNGKRVACSNREHCWCIITEDPTTEEIGISTTSITTEMPVNKSAGFTPMTMTPTKVLSNDTGKPWISTEILPSTPKIPLNGTTMFETNNVTTMSMSETSSPTSESEPLSIPNQTAATDLTSSKLSSTIKGTSKSGPGPNAKVSPSGNKDDTFMFIGIFAGVLILVFLFIIIVTAIVLNRRRKKKAKRALEQKLKEKIQSVQTSLSLSSEESEETGTETETETDTDTEPDKKQKLGKPSTKGRMGRKRKGKKKVIRAKPKKPGKSPKSPVSTPKRKPVKPS